MKNKMLITTILLLVLLFNHCTCKQRITEKELTTIEAIKGSPELRAYKATFLRRDTCLVYQQGQGNFTILRKLGLVFANKTLSDTQKEDSAKKMGVTIKPCFWESSANDYQLYQQLVQKYPQVAELSPQALQNLLFVN
jgi:hypothetical protein